MSERQPEWEWRTLEEGAAWPVPQSSTQVGIVSSRRLPRRWWWVLALLVAVSVPLLIEGYREARRAEQAMTHVEDEVRAVVAVDGWMAQHARATVDTLPAIDDGARLARDPGIKARRVEVRGDYAMVEVWVHASSLSWLPAPYRQTRFYQETPQGWLLTEPPDLFYQPLDTLQAGRFTFVYGPRDADAVWEAARQVEELDTELRAELGLPATDEPLVINVIHRQLPTLDPVDLAHLSDGSTSYVPSPALLSLPAELSEGDAALQLVAGLLVTRDLDEALAVASQVCNWRSLARGLGIWLLWEHSQMPSQAHYEIENVLEHGIVRNRVPYLTWLTLDPNACSSSPLARGAAGGYTNDNVAPTLVEYAVFAYGRARLPVLIDAMQHYTTLDDLIPAVFGVSAAEFEADWQGYLRTTYSNSPANLGLDK